ncbi:MAG: MATE family efflux transporter [Flammeovirgaceae bacterium]|nr:MATE family efflux transporter [Gammaproteobacteria bacterium]MBU83057.1 MATE family efflux transporter [Flammeovirgaceae bacterium]|tara:strand:- start:4262 stop:5581 length:1320 start_codon:yes stop_codon:yes gene_type:complete
MKLKDHLLKNLSLSFPIMISQLGHITVGVFDSLMIGKVSVSQLAAVSLATSIFSFILLFCIGLSYGITPLISSSDRGKKYVSSILYNGMLVNVISSILLVSFVILTKHLLSYLGQDEEVLFHTYSYLDIICISLIPLILFQTFKQFIEGLGFTKPSMYISVISNVINVVLNAVLIFGLFGFPRLEIIGAAYATLISRVIMFLLILIYCLNDRRFSKYILKTKFLVNLNHIKDIFRIGFASGLQYIFEVGAFSVATVMTGSIGAIHLAAHQIALNLASISYMIASGIGSASMISLSYYDGKRNFEDMRRSGFASFLLVFILMIVSALVFIIFRNYLPVLYVDDSSVINIASTLLIIAGLFQISDGIQAVGLGILRGIRDIKKPTIVTFISYWIISIPLSYFLGIEYGYGVYGIWIGLSVGLTLAAIFHVTRFNYLTFVKK